MLARLHVIISSENDEDYLAIKQQLLAINPDFSISPARPYPPKKDHSECFITFSIEKDQVQSLLDKLNNDWDGEMESCQCFQFNTKMFDQRVYSLEFDLFD